MANDQVASELPPPPKPQHLAPLEYLVNQRRGSITDPAFHSFDQTSPRHSFSSRHNSYSFPPPSTSKSLGNPLSLNVDQASERGWAAQATQPVAPDQTVDSPDPSSRHSAGPDQPRSGPSTFLPPPPYSGSKRKMSHDRQGFHYAADDPSSNPSYSPHDPDGPSPKRRSSTFDTNNRIAHLTLQDRRDSVESRSSAGPPSLGGWGDRRDSTTSMYSATSISSAGGYPSGGDTSKQYSWPQQGQSHEQHQEVHETPRSFAFPQEAASGQNQQFNVAPAPIIPSVHYSASAAIARRLSIPESSLPSNGAKSRNRRGSRNPAPTVDTSSSNPFVNVSGSPGAQMNPPASGSEGQGGVASPTSYNDADQAADASAQSPGKKDTPYSRSPELRVSHKMAERKRRKEMKDLFDELRDQLPAERGMKASKWEILSKAVDYIAQLKVAYTDMSAELDHLRVELERRGGAPSVAFKRHDFTGHHPGVQDLASEPGTPVSVTSPVGHAGSPLNSSNASVYVDRPHSAQSRRQSVAAHSPAVSTHPLQQQMTGGTTGSPMAQSPFHSHHQTPTPQQTLNPLPQQFTGPGSS